MPGSARNVPWRELKLAAIIANYGDSGNLLSLDANQREKGVRSVTRSLEIAGILGVDTILLHPGQLTVEGTYQVVWDNLRDILKNLAPVAASNRAAIGLENVWNKFLLSPKETREFVDAVNSEWVGVYLDTANMMAYGYPEHWIRGPWFANQMRSFQGLQARRAPICQPLGWRHRLALCHA